jgi:peptidoglycan/xylan/chitin deacetylase (PgdA/CDA1 family)
MSFEGVFGRRRVMEEIEQGEAVLNAILGERPKLFRPPQGFKNHRPPYYTNGRSTSVLAEKLLRNTEPGSIVNFRDGWRTGTEWDCEEMAKALSKIIEGLRAQGYRFVTLDEMVEEGKGKG